MRKLFALFLVILAVALTACGYTEAELTAAKEEGYQYGYKDGFNDGYNDGFEDNTSNGYYNGFEDGYDVGYEEGYYEGLLDKDTKATEPDNGWPRIEKDN